MASNSLTTLYDANSDESTTEIEIETDVVLEDLVEQHAARPRCKTPSCFSSEGVVYLEIGDGEYRPVCRDCRERYGVGR